MYVAIYIQRDGRPWYTTITLAYYGTTMVNIVVWLYHGYGSIPCYNLGCENYLFCLGAIKSFLSLIPTLHELTARQLGRTELYRRALDEALERIACVGSCWQAFETRRGENVYKIGLHGSTII